VQKFNITIEISSDFNLIHQLKWPIREGSRWKFYHLFEFWIINPLEKGSFTGTKYDIAANCFWNSRIINLFLDSADWGESNNWPLIRDVYLLADLRKSSFKLNWSDFNSWEEDLNYSMEHLHSIKIRKSEKLRKFNIKAVMLPLTLKNPEQRL
jgi:hypothetical protein